MKKGKGLKIGFVLVGAFILWTLAISFIDVQGIGPQSSSVGFATLNGFVHGIIGVNMTLYEITDWLGLVPIVIALGFAVLGLVQWIKRKSLFKVDYGILLLGGFYAVVVAVYLLFEIIAVNYRPVLINGILEASYPSSTTMLVLCVMPTTLIELRCRVKNKILSRIIFSATVLFVAFMVVSRVVCGVHWITDIIGGVLISSGLVSLYCYFKSLKFNQL